MQNQINFGSFPLSFFYSLYETRVNFYYRQKFIHMYQHKHKSYQSHNKLNQNRLLYQSLQSIAQRIKEEPIFSFRKSLTKEMDFDKLECLETICIVSKINFQKMREWAQEMYKVIEELQSSVQAESLSKIEFRDVTSKKAFSNQILCAVIRSSQGDIVLYQKIQAKSKKQYILSMFEVYSLQNPLIVHDQTGNVTDCLCLMQAQPMKYKFVYILNQPTWIQSIAEAKEYFTFHSMNSVAVLPMNSVAVLYPKEMIKNLQVLEQNIRKLYEFEKGEVQRFQILFGETILSYYPDRFYFLSKLITEKMKISSEAITKDTIASYLNQTSNYLNQMLSKKNQSPNSHLPKRGPNKNICCFCRKKKIETVCQGCFKVCNKNRYLCIGRCYRRYHDYLESLSFQLNQGVPLNIEYFDQKCTQMSQTMNQLLKLKNGSQFVQSFIEMTNSKLVNCLNQSIQRRLQNEIEEQYE